MTIYLAATNVQSHYSVVTNLKNMSTLEKKYIKVINIDLQSSEYA